MSFITVSPSSSQPLVVAFKNARHQLSAKKFWRIVLNEGPYRIEEIWFCSCQFGKLHTLNEADFNWTEPKRLTPPDTTVAIVLYNPASGDFLIPSIKSLHKVNMPTQLRQPLHEYKEFILNPQHKFSYPQTRAIYLQLQSWLHNEMLQFLQLWPYADKETPPPTIPTIPPTPFPSTVKDALALLPSNAHPQPSHPSLPSQHPTLVFLPQPILQPIPNLRATNFHNSNRTQITIPLASVTLRITPEGKQNRRREVFYATPTNANPTDPPIPISPLKSTVAIMYADVNPESTTFNQPIFKSINVATSTQEDIAKFLYTQINEYGAILTADQLQALTNPVKLPAMRADPTQPNPQQEPTMSTQPCAQCGEDFQPTRITSRFCSEKCRAVYYSVGRRKGPTTKPSQPQQATQPDAVTREEFQALAGQLNQVLALLQK